MAEEAAQLSRRGFLFGRLRTAVASVQTEVAAASATALAEATPPDMANSSAAGATKAVGPQLAWIGEDCLARQQVVCRTCGEMCDVGAIRFVMQVGRVAQPEVLAEQCTGCGDCIADCPILALALIPVPAPLPEAPASTA